MDVSMVMSIDTELCAAGNIASSQHPQSTIESLQKCVMVEQRLEQKSRFQDGDNFMDSGVCYLGLQREYRDPKA